MNEYCQFVDFDEKDYNIDDINDYNIKLYGINIKLYWIDIELYCIAKSINDNKLKFNFNKSDNIIIPQKYTEELLNGENFIVKIIYEDKFVYGRVTMFTAPDENIVLPYHLQNKLGIHNFELLTIKKE